MTIWKETYYTKASVVYIIYYNEAYRSHSSIIVNLAILSISRNTYMNPFDSIYAECKYIYYVQGEIVMESLIM